MENTEIWKPAVGFEELYEVSNFGNVRSLNYNHTGEIRILKPGKTNSGYLQVILCKNGKHNHCSVHRLVAEAFLANPKNLPQINHKDEDKSNNSVNNLEYVSSRTNANYGTRNKRIVEKNTNGKCSKPVLQYSLEGELLKEWPSMHEVERTLGFLINSISNCCTGRSKTSYNYVWKYKNV